MAEPGPGAAAAPIEVTVAYAAQPRQVRVVVLQMPPGATLAEAVDAAGLAHLLNAGRVAASLWGRSAEPARVLQDGDRVALCRPLRVDPKLARRQRFRQQGARAAGLFAGRRAGAKPGY